MNLPKLKKPALKRTKKPSAKPEASKSRIRMPSALEDLYRDMRDRRLLLPTLLLIVAIVAVPIALTAPKEDPPAPIPFVSPEGAEAVEPAVLAEQPVGIRDYRERLDQLKSKNPFAGSFQEPPVAPGDGELVDAPEESATSSAPAATDSAPVDEDPAAATDEPSGDAGGSGDDIPEDEFFVLAPQIDVRAGRVHERKKIKDVEQGDLLPDERKAPIVMFLGASPDLKEAHFAVSGGVTETSGDGQCRPSKNQCEVLRLREDEKQYFTFGPDAERYSLKVTDIREVIVDRRKLEVERRMP